MTDHDPTEVDSHPARDGIAPAPAYEPGRASGVEPGSAAAEHPPIEVPPGVDADAIRPARPPRDDHASDDGPATGVGESDGTHAAAATDSDGAGEPDLGEADGWPDRPDGPRVLALLNQKGGVGKTTTATNLAAALTEAGYRVLAVDLDPQAHLTLSLGLDPEQIEKSIYHLLVDPQTTAHEVVQQITDQQTGAVSVVPSEVNLAGVESELAQKTVVGAAQTTLRDKTRELTKGYDYVLLDCPPSLGILTINALAAAHEVIVPMQAHFLALQGLSKLLETVQMVRQAINPGLLISGIVLCMHERQTVLANEVVSDLNGFLEEARGTDSPWNQAVVFEPPVRRNIKLAECPSFGQSVFSYAPESNGAADYRALARHIARHRVMV